MGAANERDVAGSPNAESQAKPLKMRSRVADCGTEVLPCLITVADVL